MSNWATIMAVTVVLTAGHSRSPVVAGVTAVAASVTPSDAARVTPGEWRRPTAAVFGQVTVLARPSSPPTSLSPYARRRYRPPQQPGLPGGSEDAIVFLEPLDGTVVRPRAETTKIVQRDRTILPHVAVAQVGTTIEFPNDDDVFHNLFSLSEGNRFSLGRYRPGDSRKHQFKNAGVVRMFCDIHAEMAGVILVVNTPHVVRAGDDGVYLLGDIPDGTYRAVAWHPNAGADTVRVELRSGEEQRLDFNLIAGR